MRNSRLLHKGIHLRAHLLPCRVRSSPFIFHVCLLCFVLTIGSQMVLRRQRRQPTRIGSVHPSVALYQYHHPYWRWGRSSPISATLISGRLSDPFSDLSAWFSSQHSHLTQAWANESATRSYSLSVHLCSVLHLESLYITVLLSRRSLSASVWSRLHNSWVGKLFSVLRTLQILSSNVY
jgi:hypothetical protein